MQPDPRFFDNKGAIRPRQQSSVWRYWPLMLLVVIPISCFMCCGFSVVVYMIVGIQTTSDPARVRAGLDGMTDMQLPAGLQPHLKRLQITGVDKVEFRSGSGGSFMSLTTGERFPLQHPDTLREAR